MRVEREKAENKVLIFGAAAGVFLVLGIGLKASAKKDERHIPPSQQRTCPHCAETIQRAAKVCRFCGREVPVYVESPSPNRLIVETVTPYGAASVAGVKAGDVLLTYAGIDLHQQEDLSKAILENNADQCELTVARSGNGVPFLVKSGTLGVSVRDIDFGAPDRRTPTDHAT